MLYTVKWRLREWVKEKHVSPDLKPHAAANKAFIGASPCYVRVGSILSDIELPVYRVAFCLSI